jgi:hypothetical protein
VLWAGDYHWVERVVVEMKFWRDGYWREKYLKGMLEAVREGLGRKSVEFIGE